jgi:glycopeptide antibiotics resistance protein
MIRELYYQILVYRSLITPFLVASSVAVTVWLLYRVVRARADRGPVSLGREVILAILVGYLACVAAATLEPNRNPRLVNNDTTRVELRPSLATLTCSGATASSAAARHFCMYNARGNVLLFLPLGFLLPLLWRGLGFWKGVGIAIALSAAIEVLQLFSRTWGSYRTVDINDVILNAAGASIGLVLMLILRSLKGARPELART